MRNPEDNAQALAYVDACLEPAEAAEFERRLANDAALKGEVDAWRRQNAASRKAFEVRPATGGAPVHLRGVANANRPPSPQPPANLTHFLERRRRPLAQAQLARQAAGRLARTAVVVALASAGLAASAGRTPDQGANFRTQVERAWRTYRAADTTPPLGAAPAAEAEGALSTLLRQAWRVPGDPAPASFAFDTTPDGKRFAVLIGEVDGLPALSADVVTSEGGSSAVWSDGRRMIAIFGEEGAAATAAEARRLAGP